MTDFETSGSVRIEIDRASLREARDEVEAEIGSVSVGVDSAGARTDGGGRLGRRQRQMFRASETQADELQAQTGLLEDVVELLDDGSGGGLGGGGGGDGSLVPEGLTGGLAARGLGASGLLGSLAGAASAFGPLAPFLAGPALGAGAGRALFGDQEEELNQAANTYSDTVADLRERDGSNLPGPGVGDGADSGDGGAGGNTLSQEERLNRQDQSLFETAEQNRERNLNALKRRAAGKKNIRPNAGDDPVLEAGNALEAQRTTDRLTASTDQSFVGVGSGGDTAAAAGAVAPGETSIDVSAPLTVTVNAEDVANIDQELQAQFQQFRTQILQEVARQLPGSLQSNFQNRI